MSAARSGVAGATRPCPHCKALILESAAVCPACRGHLRFDTPATAASERSVPLKVEGNLEAPGSEALEYTVVVVVRNERGEETARHVAGVGAVFPGAPHSFSVTVEATTAAAGKRRLRH